MIERSRRTVSRDDAGVVAERAVEQIVSMEGIHNESGGLGTPNSGGRQSYLRHLKVREGKVG